MGMLNALGHFFLPALSPATFNVAGIVLSWPSSRWRRHSASSRSSSWRPAPSSAASAQVVIQWPPLAARASATSPARRPRRGPAACAAADGPGHLGLAATQINVFVNTMLATGQGTGAVSWLDFAFRLMYLPIGLFGVSVATASTPAISRMVAGAGLRAHPLDHRQRHSADDAAERAGHARPRRAGRADRRGHLRARQLHCGRHGRHRRARCSSTRSASSATRSSASCRRRSTRSAAAASR